MIKMLRIAGSSLISTMHYYNHKITLLVFLDMTFGLRLWILTWTSLWNVITNLLILSLILTIFDDGFRWFMNLTYCLHLFLIQVQSSTWSAAYWVRNDFECLISQPKRLYRQCYCNFDCHGVTFIYMQSLGCIDVCWDLGKLFMDSK